ncbi:MAG: SpoIIE family protein phosphatase [Bacteroidetes bacterium]|nr:SpoIIE family protein phosphatase [Bacteroidota bacterium]
MLKFLRQFNNVLLYAVLITIFIAVFLISESVFIKFFPRANSMSEYLVEAMLIVIIYEPLRKLIEYSIRRVLFSYYHRRQTELRELDSTLTTQMSYQELSDSATRRLREILNVRQVAYYHKLPEVLTLVSSSGNSGLLTQTLRFERSFFEKLQMHRRVLDVVDLVEHQNGTASEYRVDVLHHEGYRYLVPLFNKDRLIAIIAIGMELNNHAELTGEDKKMLWSALQRVGHTLENARLLSRLRKSATEKALVLDIAKRFNSTVHVEQLLDTILQAVKTIIPYEAAGVFLVNDGTQEIESAVVRGYDEQVLEKLNIKVGQGLIGHVAKIAKPMIVRDVTFDEHYVMIRPSTRSEMTVPISDGNQVIGVINLESDQLGAYKESDLDILDALATEAAIAIRNAQLNEQAIKNEEYNKELQIAGKIQQAILPQKLPGIANLDIAARSQPCQSVGGDFYDAFKLNESQIGLSIGDVSGKGVPGALMMAVLFSTFRRMLREYKTTSEIVVALNNMLCANTAEGKYATFFYCIIDFERLVMYYTNAGHNPPFILKKNGDWLKLQEGGVVLGFMPNLEYSQMTMLVDPGDIIVLYTDGVTEVFNEHDELFGDDRLKTVIEQNRNLSAVEIQNKIINEVLRFAPDSEQQDDITLMVIKVQENSSWS